MPSYSWKITAVLFGSFLAIATSNADNFALVNKFGNWSLTSAQEKKFILLFESTERLGVACSDASGTYTVLLKVIDSQSLSWDAKREGNYFRFTAWADSNPPKDFSFYVDPTPPLVAQIVVSLNPDLIAPSQDFWHLLKSAKTKFSYSTTAASYSFDATDLQPALTRLEESCAKIFPPYKQ
jgi:hypothetical protein